MRISRKRAQASIGLAAQAALCSIAAGSLTFNSGTSSVTLTQTEDRNPSGGETIHSPKVVSVVPTATYPTSPTFQLGNTFISDSDNAQTVADASVSQVTNALTASFNLSPGTGVTQSNSIGYYNGQSQLTLNFNMNWSVGSGGYVDPTAYISFNVAGTLTSGDSVVVVSNPSNPLTFTAVSGAHTYTVQPSISATFNTVGSFFQNITSNQFINNGNTLGAGSTLSLTGQLLFRAKDPSGPATMQMLEAEVGSAPPTDTYNVAGDGNWNNASNWTSDGLAPTIPGASASATPVRAEFTTYSTTETDQRTITLDIPVELSELDFNDTASVVIAGTTNAITFNPNFPGVVHVTSAVVGPQTINPPMIANGPSLDLQVQGSSPGLSLAGQVSAGPSTPVTKLGVGIVALNATNAISIYNASEGETDADAPGSLGTVSTTVGGDLHYNANGASAATVVVQSNGEVNLGVTPTSSDVFDVQALGTISGDDQQLAALNSSNLTLEPGAIVSHQEPGGSDPANVGSSPQLEYGIGANFDSGGQNYTMTVGSSSGTPWKGFAGDQDNETYGSDPTSATDALTIAGSADLVSLNGGTLNLNAQLAGAGVITKDGEGDVELDHQGTATFTGDIDVASGTLTVNDTLPQGDNIVVGTTSKYASPPTDPSAPVIQPTLSGTGTVDGNVEVESGGAIEPGTPDGPGLLTLDSLTMDSGSMMKFRLGGPSDTDMLVVDGNVTLDGTLDLLPQEDFQPGEYDLFSYTGTLTGEFSSIVVPDGFSITPQIVDGVLEADVEEVLPEPATISLLVLGGIGLTLRRRRGRNYVAGRQ